MSQIFGSSAWRTGRRLAVLGMVLLLAACASVPRPTIQAQPPAAPPYDAWQRVLEKYVDEQGRVNFAGVKNDRADLDRFVAWVYDYSPQNQPNLFPTPAHVLAYHINAYNALALHKVLERDIPRTLAGLRKVSFFFLGKVEVGNEPITLYKYENDVVRKLQDPRMHVALNCMSVSCPRLPREAFLPERLDEQLDREARRFYNEDRNVQVDDARRVLRLSEILKFYTGDFLAQAPSLAAYVNKYRDQKVPEDYKVEFVPYDWTINRQPGT
jgi:Protein of unknown function, DUF547